MPRINFGISGHAVPSNLNCAHISKRHFHPTNQGYNPHISRPFWPHRYRLDAYRVQLIQQALDWIRDNVVNSSSTAGTCNSAFSNLRGGRSFEEVWQSRNVWISCCLCPGNLFGIATGNDIAIAKDAYAQGWEAVAATIIHELAHVNGATVSTSDAEDTLLECGLESEHQSGLIGHYLREASGQVAYIA